MAERLAVVAQSSRARAAEPTAVARFLDRTVFCLFAEDVGLVPRNLFTRVTEKARERARLGCGSAPVATF
ncbi:MAG: type IIL restriction-modification enzyme MmeI [Pyrinomonadaceae bacterium]